MRLLLCAVAAALACAACGLDPSGVTGTVTGRHMSYDPATKANDFHLTIRVNGKDADYRVTWHTYRACPAGSTYPKCKG